MEQCVHLLSTPTCLSVHISATMPQVVDAALRKNNKKYIIWINKKIYLVFNTILTLRAQFPFVKTEKKKILLRMFSFV